MSTIINALVALISVTKTVVIARTHMAVTIANARMVTSRMGANVLILMNAVLAIHVARLSNAETQPEVIHVNVS